MTAAHATRCVACRSVSWPGDTFCEECGHHIPADEAGARHDLELGSRAVGAASDLGRRHARNEDAFATAVAPDGRVLAVVCDGVSTTATPERASRAAADAAVAAFLAAPDQESRVALEASYLAARCAVRQVPWMPEEEWAGAPSCTFLAAVVNGRDVCVGSMGDSRAFWLPEVGEPRQLTEDDSWAQEQVQAGAMTAEDAHADPHGHAITRWLGRDAAPEWMPRVVSGDHASRGRLVLCTDGLWHYAKSAADLALVMPEGDPASAALHLVEWANAQGGQDNVTVVVIDVGTADADRTEQKGPER